VQIFICYHFATKSFETVPLRSPFFAMQDGVHGRCGDLSLCHLHLFTNLLTLSLYDEIFLNSPFTIPFFLPCRMVCMAGAVTSAFTILNSLKNLLKLSL
jgi:hypothetical protein